MLVMKKIKGVIIHFLNDIIFRFYTVSIELLFLEQTFETMRIILLKESKGLYFLIHDLTFRQLQW